MQSLLLTFIPDEAFVVLIALLGLALILGILSRQVVFSILGTIILIALLSPFIEALFDSLPLWLVLTIAFIFILSIGRAILTLLFGKGATEHLVGSIIYSIFTMPFRFVGFILRGGR